MMIFSEAVAVMRSGGAVARSAWINDEKPTFLVLIPGREINASFPPMVNHLGEGAVFVVRDHFDAIFIFPNGQIECELSYTLTHEDLLGADWFKVK